MADTPPDARRLPILVALLAMLLSAWLNTGDLSPDPHTRYLVAESLLRDGDLVLEPNGLTAAADDGRHYSVFFPGQTISFLPVAAAIELARPLLPGDDATATNLGSLIANTLVVPLFAGLAVLGHIRLLTLLGVGVRMACGSGLLLAAATQQLVWATAGSEEVVLGTCVTWAFVWTLRGVRGYRGWATVGTGTDAGTDGAGAPDTAGSSSDAPTIPWSHVVRAFGFAGLLLAFGLTHRGTFVAGVLGTMALAAPAFLAAPRRLPKLALGLLPWFVASVLIVGIVPLYNAARFGDPLDSGYGRFYADIGGLWSTPLVEGLLGHLVSPGKSVFLYSPWLLLIVPAMVSPAVWRRLGVIGPALVVATVVHLLLYSKTTFWSGAFGFGVRFHVWIMPLLLVPIAVWLESWWAAMSEWASGTTASKKRELARVVRATVLAIGLWSVAMQGFGVALNTGYEFLADRTAYRADEPRIPDAAAWDPARSPILIRVRAVVRKLSGEDILPPGEPETKRIQATWNFFPARGAVAMADRRALVLGLWGAWLVLTAMTAAVGFAVVRTWRRLPADTIAHAGAGGPTRGTST